MHSAKSKVFSRPTLVYPPTKLPVLQDTRVPTANTAPQWSGQFATSQLNSSTTKITNKFIISWLYSFFSKSIYVLQTINHFQQATLNWHPKQALVRALVKFN